MPGQKAPENQRKEQILQAAFKVASSEGLDKLTVRRVAANAGLSNGLVFFHFKSKDALLVALLDWLLEGTIATRIRPEIASLPSAKERLLAIVRHEISRLPDKRQQVELFFSFWAMGTRHPQVRHKIQERLEHYRAMFRPLAAEILAQDPATLPGISAESLSAMVVAIIEGCAMQVTMAPEHFDVEAFIASTERLFGIRVPGLELYI